MEKSFRQSMEWLHTWSGLIVGWLLFAIFVTGTSAYYRDEINYWMKPELHNSKATENTLDIAKEKVFENLKKTNSIYVTLPNSRSNVISMFWRKSNQENLNQNANSKKRKKRGRVFKSYDASSGEQIDSRPTAGGNFLYRFHFELYSFPRNIARWIVGIATMSMFIAIITGIIIHKRIFKDIFVFRPKKGVRTWMDLHILPAVAALPFHIMITYSGLLLFMRLMMPWGLDTAYQDNPREYREDINKLHIQQEKIVKGAITNDSKASFSKEKLENILDKANKIWPNNIGGFSISKTRDDSTIVEIRPKEVSTIFSFKFEREYLKFDGETSQLISKNIPPSSNSAVLNTHSTFETLHRARFADSTFRFVFFICGISGVLLIASGLILWVDKRKKRNENKKTLGYRLVEKLNLGTIIGIFIAIGAYFIANRIIPAFEDNRVNLEINIFFITWLLSYIHAFLRDIKKAWIEQLLFAAAVYIAIIIINIITTINSFNNFINRDSILLYFDLYFLLSAIIFALISYILIRKKRRSIIQC